MGVTIRSIVIGAILIPLTCMWVCLAEIMWYSGQPTTVSLFCHVVFIIFLIALLNLCVRRLKPQWALTAPEILVIYTMLCLASALCGHDMIEILVPTLSHLGQFAAIENRYEELLPYVPQWLVVNDQHALRSAYLGQESIFDPRNLVPWLKPLAWWFGFIMALCAVLWAMNLVFRKQWTENEKLAYPIIQVPMFLAERLHELLTNRLFWVAFGIAAFIDALNGINVLFPLLPKIPVVHVVNIQDFFPERPWNAIGATFVSFYPFAIGLCFFMPTDLAFSCWFFYIFWKFQRIGASYIGVHGMPGFPFVEEQTAGGYYCIALTAIWISRNHLRRVVSILVGRGDNDVTPWERAEVRIAAVLLAAGCAYLLYFCMMAQMSFPIVLAFFTIYFLISLSVTRMRAELGPPSHDLHNIGPHYQIVRFLGAANMHRDHPRDLVMFGFFNFFNRAYRGNPMPHGMEAFRIAERLNMDNLRYLIAMGLAMVLGTFFGFFAMLWVFDKYGASAQAVGPGEWFGREAWDMVNNWFTVPEPHQYQPTYAILIGLVFCLGLSALRMNLTWWPFHPVGYAISGSWAMEQLWMCVFLAWLAKTILLKYGGAKMYKPAVPFFVGLILGDFTVGSFWNLYGIIMEQQIYHFWPY